jgi:hypothetical protein
MAVESVHNVLSNDRTGALMFHVYLLQYGYSMTACKWAFIALDFDSNLDPPSSQIMIKMCFSSTVINPNFDNCFT